MCSNSTDIYLGSGKTPNRVSDRTGVLYEKATTTFPKKGKTIIREWHNLSHYTDKNIEGTNVEHSQRGGCPCFSQLVFPMLPLCKPDGWCYREHVQSYLEQTQERKESRYAQKSGERTREKNAHTYNLQLFTSYSCTLTLALWNQVCVADSRASSPAHTAPRWILLIQWVLLHILMVRPYATF